MKSMRIALALVVIVSLAWLGSLWVSHVRPATPEGAVDPVGVWYEPVSTTALNTGAALGLLLLGSFLMGKLVARAGLPSIVGYLLFGMVCGPSLLGLVDPEELRLGNLALVNDLAVALIGLTAGGEIHFSFLRRSARAVGLIAVCVVGVVFVGVTLASMLMLPRLGWEGLERSAIPWVALVVATVMVTNSPAVLVAVISEMRARGMMAQLSLAVTVIKDLLVLVLFAVILTLATARLGGGEAESTQKLVGQLARELGGSLAVGAGMGLLFAWYIHKVEEHLAVFVVLACFAIAIISEALHVESLLVAVVAGMLVSNIWRERGEELFETSEELSTPVYCVFFAFAGAEIDLAGITEVWHWALAIVVIRGFLVMGGTALGARLGGAPAEVRGWLWTAFLPQAGVALALVVIASRSLAEAGFAYHEELRTLVVACVAYDKILGPLAFKIGLMRGSTTPGEVERADEPPSEGR